MDRLKGEGRGNAGLWTPRKTEGRFSTAPTALGNRCAIPTFPPPRLGVEKWKTESRFPTFPLVVFTLETQFRKEAWRRSLRSRPQAHSSMRICLRAYCEPVLRALASMYVVNASGLPGGAISNLMAMRSLPVRLLVRR